MSNTSLTKGKPTSPGKVTTGIPAGRLVMPVVSDSGLSYIASDVQYAYYAVDRALPQTIDEEERRHGIEIYERMLAEPILAGVERVLKILVLSDGISIATSHPQPRKTGATTQELADFEQSKAVADYCDYVIKRLSDLDRPLTRILWNLLDGARLGHKLAEITYDIIPNGPFAGKVGLESIRCKPRLNYTIVLDTMNTFRAIIGKIPGASIVVWQGIILDASQLANAVAPEKVLLFNLEEIDGNVQGRSWFRSLYDPYRRKQILKPEEIRTGVQFGGGMTSVIAPEMKSGIFYTDPDTGLKVNILQALQTAASSLCAGRAAVFPNGTQVNVHQPSANPTFFETAFNRYDREMVTAFLLSARSILEARHGSKADVDSSQDLLDELKVFVRQTLCELLTYKLLKPLVRMSFGPDIAEEFCPQVVMAKASRPDFAVNATAVAALQTSGYIDPSQQPEIDTEILGLPERDPQAAPAEAVDGDPADEEDPVDDTGSPKKEAAPAPAGANFRSHDARFGRGLSGIDAARAGRARKPERPTDERKDRRRPVGGSDGRDPNARPSPGVIDGPRSGGKPRQGDA